MRAVVGLGPRVATGVAGVVAPRLARARRRRRAVAAARRLAGLHARYRPAVPTVQHGLEIAKQAFSKSISESGYICVEALLTDVAVVMVNGFINNLQ